MSFMSEVLLQLAKWGHEHDFGVNILKLLLRPSHQYIDIFKTVLLYIVFVYGTKNIGSLNWTLIWSLPIDRIGTLVWCFIVKAQRYYPVKC